MAENNSLVNWESFKHYDEKLDEVIKEINDKLDTSGYTIDSALSETSTNPVQNKIITEVLETKANKDDIPTELPANGGNADTLDGLHVNEIASNPNLLINPDFKINQRGLSEYTEHLKCAVDRWVLNKHTWVDEDKLTVEDTGIKLTLTTGNWIRPVQIFENALTETFTVTVNIRSATPGVRFDIIVLDNGQEANISANLLSGNTQTITATYTPNTSVTNFHMNLRYDNGFGEVTIAWAKLEVGKFATPFISPNPTLELIKCGIPDDTNTYGYRPTGVGSNPNLLDNPDFSINQRGDSEYALGTRAYTVDRWWRNEFVKVTVLDSGVKLYTDGTGADNGQIIQRIENYQKYAGKKLTMSCYISDMTDEFIMQVYDGVTWHNHICDTIGFNSKTITVANNPTGLAVALIVPKGSAREASISWAKLEVGTVATQFVPPNPAEELAKCQRYYEVLIDKNRDVSVHGWVSDNGAYASATFPLKVTKRTYPSLTSDSLRMVVIDKTTGGLLYSDMVKVHIKSNGADTNIVSILTDDGELDSINIDIDNHIVEFDTHSCDIPFAVSADM